MGRVIPTAGERRIALNGLDIGIILLALVVLIRSYLRGLVQEVAALGGLVLAVVVGLRFHGRAERYLEAAFGPAPWLSAAGFIILFLATLILVALISSKLSKVMAKGPMGGIDRLLGLCFGAVKAAVLAVLCVFLLTFIAGPNSPLLTESRLAPRALTAADWVLERLPRGLSKSLAESRQELEEAFSDLTPSADEEKEAAPKE